MHGVVTGWGDFATVAGGAAGALIGLLFVAVSIRIEVIAPSPELRNRAAQTLGLFTIVLLIGFAIAIPTQQLWVLGAEMMSLAVAAAGALYWLDRRARRSPSGKPLAHVLDVVAPNTLTCTLLVVAGGLLLAGRSWGIYIVVVATVVASVGGVTSTWLLLIRLAD